MSMYNRRYYIHYTLKGIVQVRAKSKTVSLTETEKSELTTLQLKKVLELKTKFNYSIQTLLDL